MLSETFETAITWDRFAAFHERRDRRRRADALREVCGGGSVTCRFTHVYPDGPAPYYTILAPARRGGELEQWAQIKRGRLGRGDRRRRHDHPPPRRRPRPPPVVRPPAARAVRGGAARGAKAAVDPARRAQPRRADRPVTPPELYDTIGRSYTTTRRPDPRIATAIWDALGDARTVLNVGAGAGAYEPADREVVALEPSPVMIAQRPPGAAPVVRGRAEDLPFEDGAFDAVMAVLSDHHWTDRAARLSGATPRGPSTGSCCSTRTRGEADLFWLTTEYLPEFLDVIPARYRQPGTWESELRAALGRVHIVPVPVAHDCLDGFYGAFWRRPEAYLDPGVRAGISVFAQVSSAAVDRAIDALGADLDTGRWHQRHRGLLALSELHLGYYVIIAEPDLRTGGRT